MLPGLPVFTLTYAELGERRGATGHVSSVGEFETFWEYMLDDAIITTAINPGLAGAPLFDRDGSVIGIVTLSLTGVARYTLAVPVSYFLARREEMERGDQARAMPPRAWAGLHVHRQEGGVRRHGGRPRPGPPILPGSGEVTSSSPSTASRSPACGSSTTACGDDGRVTPSVSRSFAIPTFT